MKNKKRAFTLVELLAVIVILAVILVIAIPQIINVIKSARLSSIKDSAMLIAEQAEKDYLSQQVLNKDYNSTSIPCSDVAKLNDDYASCKITYNNGVATVKLKGSTIGKFANLQCTGTKDNMNCKEKIPKKCVSSDSLKFIDGQYTYTYYNGPNGWGVELTDKQSTEPVITELCSTINNKPIVSMYSMFSGSKTSSIDFSSFDTSNVTDMSSMFRDINISELNLTDIDTSKVVNMNLMFFGTNVEKLDLKNFDTSNVTNMYWMFLGCKAATIDISNFNTSKVTNMSSMFENSDAATIKFPNQWTTAENADASRMFMNNNAGELDLSGFDTSKVTNMSSMFQNSKASVIKFSNKFNTNLVTNMRFMFRDTKANILDLSSFNTGNVTNKEDMFSGSKSTTVYARNEEEITRLSNGTSKPSTMNIVLKNN